METRARYITHGVLLVLALLYAALYLPFRNEMAVPVGLMALLGIYTYVRYHRDQLTRLPHWLFWLAALLPVMTWLLVRWQVPEDAMGSPRSEDFANKFIFLLPAIALAADIRRIWIFWGVAALSALLLPWILGGGWSEVIAAWGGKRTGFGRHIITMGMVYATLLIAALVFLHRFVIKPGNQMWRWILWSVSVAGAITGVVGSASRSIYLGLILLSTIVVIVGLITAIKKPVLRPYLIKIGSLAAVITILSQLIIYQSGIYDNILSRIDKATASIEAFINTGIESVPFSSSGLRIHFWHDTVGLISERPISGWGLGANERMHEKANNRFGKRYFITVHNDILEFLLAFGILGLSVMIALVAWLCRQAYLAWRASALPGDVLIFFGLFIVFYLFNGLFLSTFFFRDSIFLWNIVAAGITGFIIKASQEHAGQQST